jgi:GT2 family glycosyltransferase/glycosyltransferase involved in cell wall biosynthesis
MDIFSHIPWEFRAPLQFLNRDATEEKYKKLILGSNLFDYGYYVEQYAADIAKSGLDPAIHYLRNGLDGYNPSKEFDGASYLAEYPDVRAAKINPLVHYLRHGQHEGRRTYRVLSPAAKPEAPTKASWDELVSLNDGANKRTPVIDIIVPAYRGFGETASCLYTVLRSRQAGTLACEVVVVDDASPEPQLSALLDELADRGLLTLLRNEKNIGFVASVNKGMELHNDRDVILLNSDTEVYGDWVERLHHAAYSESNIGTVTPLSNNATICSYPIFPGEFKGAFEISFEEMDRLASTANAGMTVDIPTAVGFCMYIRRECLVEVGLFDAQAFGRGYGEENDFSLRIAARGWRNVLAGDVFVRHLGRVSFLDTTDDRIRQALEIIQARYPGYLATIAAYVKNDPPKKLRRNLDIARLRDLTGPRSFLFVLHNLGGGTLRHVHELSDLLRAEGIGSLYLQPHPKDGDFGVISHAGVENLSTGPLLDIKHGLKDAATTLRDLGVTHIHLHHILGFCPEITPFVKALATACGLSYYVTLHDYTLVCPRVTMIDGSGRYCGNLDVETCEACVNTLGSPVGNVSVWCWRASHEEFLGKARRVFVPDVDVKTRFKDFFPSVNLTVRAHPEPLPKFLATPVVRQPGETLRVAIIGAIGPHKGSLVLLQCAQDAARRRLPIRFHLFGYTDREDLRALPNVSLTGKYSDDQLDMLLARSQCHLAFFPSVWPETYSYTLSQGWFAGLYPVAFDIGAIANRIQQSGWGCLLSNEMMMLPAKINDALLSLQPPDRPDGFSPMTGSHLYESIRSDYYEMDLAPVVLDKRQVTHEQSDGRRG